MTDYPSLFLGVMAVALAIMAIVQIGLIVVALRVARQLTTTASQLQQEVRPLIAEATAVTQKASAIAEVDDELRELVRGRHVVDAFDRAGANVDGVEMIDCDRRFDCCRSHRVSVGEARALATIQAFRGRAASSTRPARVGV